MPGRKPPRGWKLIDGPGVYRDVDKRLLRIDPSYQRPEVPGKIREMASAWSWMACGVLLVARRGEGLYVYDGQQRLAAALRRPDIEALPCLVFETGSAGDEAGAFIRSNTLRKPVEAVWKFRALVVSGDPRARELSGLIEGSGYRVAAWDRANAVRCVLALQKAYQANEGVFRRVWPFVAELCAGGVVHHRVFEALFWLECQLSPRGLSLTRQPWRRRVLRLGVEGILEATARASAFYARGGMKVWGSGVSHALNKGLAERGRLPVGEPT